jgi:hypothetical protein
MLWAQGGLPLVGEKTTLRWLGSSVLELKIQQAKPPFRSAEILVVLEPRDVAPLWVMARLRGRRDLFIFRGVLRRPPSIKLEALDTTSWRVRRLPDQVKNWTALQAPAPLVAYTPASVSAASEVLKRATLNECPLQLLAIREGEPNFELQWRLDPLRRHPAREVFETVQRVTAGL